MSKKFGIVALASAFLAFSPLAMAQSSQDENNQTQAQEQQSAAPQQQPAQNQGPGQPNAPGGCYNSPQHTGGC